jgi:hypothetical protein
MNNTKSRISNSLSALFGAVRECRAKPPGDPQRIIVLLAPSLGQAPPLRRGPLRRRGALLVEGDELDTARLNFLKFLANRTRIVPLLLASARAWKQWNRRRALEAAQIRRRTHMVLELGAPSSINK